MKIPGAIRKCVIFILLAGMFISLLFAVFHPLEPRYEGKPLSVWAADLVGPEASWDTKPPPDALAKQDQAVIAIQHFGIQALPLALKLCGTEDSAPMEKFKDWVNDQKVFPVQLPSDYDYQMRGLKIFEVLGPAARSAIPSLIKSFQKERPYTRSTASDALLYIGPDAIPPLIEALTNSNERTRYHAAMTLCGFEKQARRAVPAMLRCLADKNPRVRSAAALSLGSLGGEPTVVIPALLQCLRDQDAGVSEMAALSLGHIHQDPERVVPALLDYLQTETNTSIAPFYVYPALGGFGTNAKPWSPRLIQMIRPVASDRFNIFAGAALGALNKIDPDAAKPLIEERSTAISNAWLQTQLHYSDSQPTISNGASADKPDLIRTPNPPLKQLKYSANVKTNSAPP